MLVALLVTTSAFQAPFVPQGVRNGGVLMKDIVKKDFLGDRAQAHGFWAKKEWAEYQAGAP